VNDIDIRARCLFRNDAIFAIDHTQFYHLMLESFISLKLIELLDKVGNLSRLWFSELYFEIND
jgi:hypothetical protein